MHLAVWENMAVLSALGKLQKRLTRLFFLNHHERMKAKKHFGHSCTTYWQRISHFAKILNCFKVVADTTSLQERFFAKFKKD